MKPALSLQLWSLRNEHKEEPAKRVAMAAALGYDGIELAGNYGLTSSQWTDLLAHSNLQAVSAHIGLESLESAFDTEAAFVKALGASRLAVPSLPPAVRTPTGYREAATRLNKAGQNAKAAGLTLHYHNHAFEFEKLEDGSCGMDILLAHTDPALVRFQFDTYWIEHGGHEAAAYIKARAGRTGMIHAKEILRADNSETAPGNGDIDFKAIFEMAWQHQWPVIVEYEKDDALQALKTGAANLRKLIPA